MLDQIQYRRYNVSDSASSDTMCQIRNNIDDTMCPIQCHQKQCVTFNIRCITYRIIRSDTLCPIQRHYIRYNIRLVIEYTTTDTMSQIQLHLHQIQCVGFSIFRSDTVDQINIFRYNVSHAEKQIRHSVSDSASLDTMYQIQLGQVNCIVRSDRRDQTQYSRYSNIRHSVSAQI